MYTGLFFKYDIFHDLAVWSFVQTIHTHDTCISNWKNVVSMNDASWFCRQFSANPQIFLLQNLSIDTLPRRLVQGWYHMYQGWNISFLPSFTASYTLQWSLFIQPLQMQPPSFLRIGMGYWRSPLNAFSTVLVWISHSSHDLSTYH